MQWINGVFICSILEDCNLKNLYNVIDKWPNPLKWVLTQRVSTIDYEFVKYILIKNKIDLGSKKEINQAIKTIQKIKENENRTKELKENIRTIKNMNNNPFYFDKY